MSGQCVQDFELQRGPQKKHTCARSSSTRAAAFPTATSAWFGLGPLYIWLCAVRSGRSHSHIYIYIIYIYIYMVRRLAFPAPPPPQCYGLVRGGTGWGGGGGAGVCGEGWGPLELQLEKRPGVTDQASKVCKPYASHKSYNVAQ